MAQLHQVFFYLLLVFLPTQLGLHVWPEWSMVLGRRVDYLSPTLYATDVLIFLILAFWLLAGRKKFSVSWIPVIAIAGFIGLNIFFAVSPMVAAYKWLKVLEFGLLGLYIVQTRPHMSRVVFFLSIGGLYSSLLAILQFLLQRALGGPLWLLGERAFSASTPGIAQVNFTRLLLRSYATFPHPNVLGGFLAILLPLMIREAKNRKVYYVTTIVLGMIALVVTFSRSAWIVGAAGIAYALGKKNKKLFIPLAILTFLILFFVGTTVGLQEEAVVIREELNRSAITMFYESPLIGKGLGNFLVHLPQTLVSREIYFLQPVHNMFLLALSETGIIGFSFFIWIIWRARKNWIIAAVIFLGLVDHYFLTLQQGQLLLTILLACTMAL